jgi:hypothetical protein
MAIRKFRSVEEMDGYRWYEPGDPVLFRAIRRVWELGYRTIRPRFPAGVHRHRSLASKNALQEAWADANFSAYQQRLREELARLKGASPRRRGPASAAPPRRRAPRRSRRAAARRSRGE